MYLASQDGQRHAIQRLLHTENQVESQGSRKKRARLYHRRDDAPPSTVELHEQYFDLSYEAGKMAAEPAIPPNPNLVVVLDDLRSQWNVGSIFRTSECLGWGGLVLCGITPMPPSKRVTRVSLGAEDVLPWTYHASSLEAVRKLQTEGFTPIALELTHDAVPIDSIAIPEKCALIIGNEVSGVSKEVLATCRLRASIPMAGRKASLNAAIAFGIAAHIFRSPQTHQKASDSDITE